MDFATTRSLWNLPSLPVEVLAPILRYIDSEDFYHLLLIGDPILGHKLSQPGILTHIHVNGASLLLELAPMIRRIPKLTSLALEFCDHQYVEKVLCSREIIAQFANLESLTLRSLNAAAVWQVCAQHWPEAWQNAQHLNFAVLFPKLRHLSLHSSHTMARFGAEDGITFPPNLVSLHIDGLYSRFGFGARLEPSFQALPKLVSLILPEFEWKAEGSFLPLTIEVLQVSCIFQNGFHYPDHDLEAMVASYHVNSMQQIRDYLDDIDILKRPYPIEKRSIEDDFAVPLSSYVVPSRYHHGIALAEVDPPPFPHAMMSHQASVNYVRKKRPGYVGLGSVSQWLAEIPTLQQFKKNRFLGNGMFALLPRLRELKIKCNHRTGLSDALRLPQHLKSYTIIHEPTLSPFILSCLPPNLESFTLIAAQGHALRFSPRVLPLELDVSEEFIKDGVYRNIPWPKAPPIVNLDGCRVQIEVALDLLLTAGIRALRIDTAAITDSFLQVLSEEASDLLCDISAKGLCAAAVEFMARKQRSTQSTLHARSWQVSVASKCLAIVKPYCEKLMLLELDQADFNIAAFKEWKKLRSLTSEWITFTDSFFDDLPSSLTEIDLLSRCDISYKLLAKMPPQLISVTVRDLYVSLGLLEVHPLPTDVHILTESVLIECALSALQESSVLRVTGRVKIGLVHTPALMEDANFDFWGSFNSSSTSDFSHPIPPHITEIRLPSDFDTPDFYGILPTSLRVLQLEKCGSLSDELVERLPRSLEELSLDKDVNFTPSSFALLPPNLKLLSLPSYPHVTDAHLQHLPTSLESLNLNASGGITDRGVALLPTTLKRLSLASASFAPTCLGHLPSLTQLDVSTNTNFITASPHLLPPMLQTLLAPSQFVESLREFIHTSPDKYSSLLVDGCTGVDLEKFKTGFATYEAHNTDSSAVE